MDSYSEEKIIDFSKYFEVYNAPNEQFWLQKWLNDSSLDFLSPERYDRSSGTEIKHSVERRTICPDGIYWKMLQLVWKGVYQFFDGCRVLVEMAVHWYWMAQEYQPGHVHS